MIFLNSIAQTTNQVDFLVEIVKIHKAHKLLL